MLKATIGSILALSLAVSMSGCDGKPKETAQPAAAAPPPAAMPQDAAAMNHPPAKPVADVDLAGITKPEGGKTIAEVFAEKDALASQKVTVRGKVVKANSGILDKDWLHVRDGSGGEGTNDLTVTTKSTPLPKVGDVVTVTGPVSLNKDFGAGYSYEVIVEDAEVKIESSAQ